MNKVTSLVEDAIANLEESITFCDKCIELDDKCDSAFLYKGVAYM